MVNLAWGLKEKSWIMTYLCYQWIQISHYSKIIHSKFYNPEYKFCILDCAIWNILQFKTQILTSRFYIMGCLWIPHSKIKEKMYNKKYQKGNLSIFWSIGCKKKGMEVQKETLLNSWFIIPSRNSIMVFKYLIVFFIFLKCLNYLCFNTNSMQ